MMTAMDKFKNIECKNPELIVASPIERLRFFCSLSMSPDDWLEVEEFLHEVEKQIYGK